MVNYYLFLFFYFGKILILYHFHLFALLLATYYTEIETIKTTQQQTTKE